MIESGGLTLVGISLTNLEDADGMQLTLPRTVAPMRSTRPSTRCATDSERWR